jgi:hypothetical protein
MCGKPIEEGVALTLTTEAIRGAGTVVPIPEWLERWRERLTQGQERLAVALKSPLHYHSKRAYHLQSTTAILAGVVKSAYYAALALLLPLRVAHCFFIISEILRLVSALIALRLRIECLEALWVPFLLTNRSRALVKLSICWLSISTMFSVDILNSSFWREYSTLIGAGKLKLRAP